MNVLEEFQSLDPRHPIYAAAIAAGVPVLELHGVWQELARMTPSQPGGLAPEAVLALWSAKEALKLSRGLGLARRPSPVPPAPTMPPNNTALGRMVGVERKDQKP